jgi:hypothetical protein
LYQNQFISVHSNIAHEDTYPLNSDYLTNDGRVEKISSGVDGSGADSAYGCDESKLISHFMMVANSYYTPKIFDLTNLNLQEIIISFIDACGELELHILEVQENYKKFDKQHLRLKLS